MFQIVVPGKELYDSVNNLFIPVKGQTLTLEHSLISISKWEMKYHRPYFSEDKKDVKTTEETIDYIRFMTLTKNVDPMIYYGLSDQNYKDIVNFADKQAFIDYIKSLPGEPLTITAATYAKPFQHVLVYRRHNYTKLLCRKKYR